MSERKVVNLKGFGVNPEIDKRLNEAHYEILYKLVWFIYQWVSTELNYDHIKTNIPCKPVSLEYKGKRYDISLIYKGVRVLIEVDTTMLKPEEVGGW